MAENGYSGPSLEEILKGIRKEFDSFNSGLLGNYNKELYESGHFKRQLRGLANEIDNLNDKADELKRKYNETTDTEELEKITNALKNVHSQINSISNEMDKIDSKTSGFFNKTEAHFNGIINISNNVKKSIKGMYGSVSEYADSWRRADKAASNYAKTIGTTAAGMAALRKNTIDTVNKNHLSIDFNVDIEKAIKLQEDYAKAIGRNARVGGEDITSMAALSNMGFDIGAWGNAFDTFGMGISDVEEHLNNILKDTSKHGLSFEKTTNLTLQNIKMAQNYTFKDGVKGLENMAKRAAALKMDMQIVSTLAEKVSTVEGAIDVASNLQVLGGPFANFADPMGMLNEGLNDIEGLGTRISKMISRLGTFNKETNQVTFSSYNRTRIKQAAKVMGVSPESLMEQATMEGRRGAIEKEINATPNAAKWDKDFRELIKNTATFKNGKAVVSIGGKDVNLKDLEGAEYDQLVKETQDQSKDIKDISRNLQSLCDREQGLKGQLEAKNAEVIEKTGIGETLGNLNTKIGRTNWLLGVLSGLLAAQTVGGIIKNGKDLIGGKGLDLFGIFRRGGGGKTTGVANSIMKNRGLESKLAKVFGKKIPSSSGKIYHKLGNKLFNAQGRMVTDAVKNKILKKGAKEAIKRVGRFGLKSVARGGLTSLMGGAGGMSGLLSSVGPALAAAGPALAVAAGVAATAAAVHYGRKKAKENRTKELDTRLKSLGIEKQGDYSPERLKRINKALETGEMSNSLKKKLLREGDTAIIAEIEKKKTRIEEEEEAKKEAKRKKRIERIKDVVGIFKGNEEGDGIKKSLKSAYFNIEVAHFGGKAMLSPKLELGSFEKIRSRRRRFGFGGENNEEDSKPRDFNININGTLKLEGQNGQSIDIINILKKNPQMQTALADMIEKEIGKINKGAYVTNKCGR